MRIVFLGSAAFAAPSLRALIEVGHEIALVVTQPDRPGNRRRLTPPPLKLAASELGLEVFQPERIASDQSQERLVAAGPELIVVVAYGQIIPRRLLDLPPRGVINVHASLLPRHRGAAPIAAAIREGDQKTGVTIMQMDQALDHGPVLASRETEIGPLEDAAGLTSRLALLGAALLAETLSQLDRLRPVAQDESLATVATKLHRQDGEFDWNVGAVTLDRTVRAFRPWPGVTLPWRGGRIKVLRGHLGDGQGEPGAVLGSGQGWVEVACGEGSYKLLEVQVPGRRPMPGDELTGADEGF